MTDQVSHGEILSRIETLTEQVKEMRGEIAETREIIQAWQAVKTGGVFITWIAKVVTGIVALVAVFKFGLSDFSIKP